MYLFKKGNEEDLYGVFAWNVTERSLDRLCIVTWTWVVILLDTKYHVFNVCGNGYTDTFSI